MGLTHLPRGVRYPLPPTPHDLFQKHELVQLLKSTKFYLLSGLCHLCCSL